MKILIKSYIIPAAAAVFLSGCTSDFIPDSYGEEVLVINALAMGGEPVTATITHSWPIGAKPENVSLPAANVELWVDGALAETMVYDAESKEFAAQHAAAVGETVEVRVRDAKYGSASGSTTVPLTLDLGEPRIAARINEHSDAWSVENGEAHEIPYLEFTLDIPINDHKDVAEYMMVSDITGFYGSLWCDDPILNENESSLDAIIDDPSDFAVFSDRSFDGHGYLLRLKYEIPYTRSGLNHLLDEENSPKVTISTISTEYYLYLLSLRKKFGGINGILEEAGLAEPRDIYTNVSAPGAGIVAAQNSSTITISLTSYAEEYLEKLNSGE